MHKTEKWVDYVAYICLALNGAAVAALFAYFAKGTPQRLKELSRNAAKISKNRGLNQPVSNQDAVADLDMVLQELATALTEAEEREKVLRQQLAEKTYDPLLSDSGVAISSLKTPEALRQVIFANTDPSLMETVTSSHKEHDIQAVTDP